MPVKLRSRGMVPRAPRSPDMSKRDCCVCVCQFVYSWHAARGYPSSASMQARAVMSFHAAGWPMEPCSNAEVNLICELRYGTRPPPKREYRNTNPAEKTAGEATYAESSLLHPIFDLHPWFPPHLQDPCGGHPRSGPPPQGEKVCQEIRYNICSGSHIPTVASLPS